MFYNWPHLLDRSKAAIARMESSKCPELGFGDFDAIDSIIMAVASLEGFANELGQVASILPSCKETRSFGDAMRALESNRANLREKYERISDYCKGLDFDFSSKPSQAFAALVDLRNAIIHCKPLWAIDTPKHVCESRLFRKLKQYGVVNPSAYDKSVVSNWLKCVSTMKCAKWSHATAELVISVVIGYIPNEELKRKMEMTNMPNKTIQQGRPDGRP